MTSDPFLLLVRDLARRHGEDFIEVEPLDPPAFAPPAKAGHDFGWLVCVGCERAIEPGASVVFRGASRSTPYHASCAALELHELRSAA